MIRILPDSPEQNPFKPGKPADGGLTRPAGGGADDEELFLRKTFEDRPKEACGLLFKRYHAVLCNHAVRLVYSRQVAEDLVAEVFYQFWKKEVYRHITTSYRGYLFRAVRNRAYNYLQLELSRKATLDDFSLASTLRLPDEYLFFIDLSRKVELLVEALPPQGKKVFIMHRFEGKTYQEIAEALQLSARTVEVHCHRALAVLRRGLQEGGFLGLLVAWLAG
jgi:RNA polymerase sigma-70 factor (ECF subfamily)